MKVSRKLRVMFTCGNCLRHLLVLVTHHGKTPQGRHLYLCIKQVVQHSPNVLKIEVHTADSYIWHLKKLVSVGAN